MSLNSVRIADIGPAGYTATVVLDDPSVRKLLETSSIELAQGACEACLEAVLLRRDDAVGGSQASGAGHGAILLRGRLKAHYWVPCCRCLEPACVDAQESDLDLCFFPPSQHMAAEDGMELGAEDLSSFTHDGETLDLLELMREYMVLALPMSPLCSETCAGVALAQGDQAGTSAGWRNALSRLKDTVKS